MNIENNQPATNLYAQNLANRTNANAAKESGNGVKPQATPIGEKVEISKLDGLRNQPEIRPEVVAKGKELLNDPNYPSKEMVNAIAKLIVPFADDE